MSDYISLLTFNTPVDENKVRRQARHGCLAIHRVDWLGVWLDLSSRRLLCWYQAKDAESYSYALSFSDHLIRHWDWQELFASQAEVKRYLQHVANHYVLSRHIRLGTRIAKMDCDNEHHLWRIETEKGERVTARFLIAATGSLSAPQLPDIPGIDQFEGESHTGRWPAAGNALEGKRVGVVARQNHIGCHLSWNWEATTSTASTDQEHLPHAITISMHLSSQVSGW